MTKPGPRRTPIATLKLQGSRLTKAREKAEPKPKAGRPRRPKGLSKDEACIWNQVCPILEAMRVLTVADCNMLEQYCALFVRWRVAKDFLMEHGEFFVVYQRRRNGTCILDDKGKKMIQSMPPFPQVAIEKNTGIQLLKIAQEFGLTPSARASLSISPKAAEEVETRKSLRA